MTKAKRYRRSLRHKSNTGYLCASSFPTCKKKCDIFQIAFIGTGEAYQAYPLGRYESEYLFGLVLGSVRSVQVSVTRLKAELRYVRSAVESADKAVL